MAGKISLTNVVLHTLAQSIVVGTTTLGSYGVNAQIAGQVVVQGGSITTDGGFGIGARASGAGSTIFINVDPATQAATGTSSSVTTSGINAHGLLAVGGGVIGASATTIDTTGIVAIGAFSAGSTIRIAGGSITTRGA